MLQAAKDFKPDVVVVLGDFADFYAVSTHSKDPKRRFQLLTEIQDVKQGLKELLGLKARKNIFIAGNHEDRLQRYLNDTAPELADLIEIPKVLGLEKEWVYVPYKADYRLGKLYLTHDLVYTGRNSIYRCLDAYQHSNVTGHTHRLGYVIEGDASGESKVAAQFGWLGDTDAADYMHRMKARKDWTLGFGIGYLDTKTGIVYLTPIPIVKYSCVLEGRFYKIPS